MLKGIEVKSGKFLGFSFSFCNIYNASSDFELF